MFDNFPSYLYSTQLTYFLLLVSSAVSYIMEISSLVVFSVE